MKAIKGYIIISIIALAVFFLIRSGPTSLPGPNSMAQVKIGEQTFLVEIADQPVEQARGLTGKSSLPLDQGMLFVFDKSDFHSFWMKGMSFPLDIIWIKNEQVVDLAKSVPLPEGDKILSYVPEQEANYVLEVNAGLAERYNWQIGDSVEIEWVDRKESSD